MEHIEFKLSELDEAMLTVCNALKDHVLPTENSNFEEKVTRFINIKVEDVPIMYKAETIGYIRSISVINQFDEKQPLYQLDSCRLLNTCRDSMHLSFINYEDLRETLCPED